MDYKKKTHTRLMLPQRVKLRERFKTSKFKNPIDDEYRLASKGVAAFLEENIPLEKTLDVKKFAKRKAYNLAILTLKHAPEIEYLMKKLKISENNFHLKNCKGKVIIADLLWGDQYMKSASSRPVETIKFFEDSLRDNFIEATLRASQDPMEIPACKLPVYVRINTLQISLEKSIQAFQTEGWHYLPSCKTYSEYLRQLRNLNGYNFMRDFHISELFVFPSKTDFYDHPGLKKGKFLIQDKSSCLASFLLNPKPNSVVCDMFAAPGLKTSHIAAIIENKGKIFANDIHPRRYEDLKRMSRLTGVECAEFSSVDCLESPGLKTSQYVLLDPSCSYSGIFYGIGKTGIHKSKDVQKRKNALVLDLTKSLIAFANNGRRLVYTANTVYPDEGEMIVDTVMNDLGTAYELLNVKKMLWNEWHSECFENYECSGKCLRTNPSYDGCQGCFIAVFERIPNVPIEIEPKIVYNKKIYNQSEMREVEFTTRNGVVRKRFVPIEKANQMKEEKQNYLNHEYSGNVLTRSMPHTEIKQNDEKYSAGSEEVEIVQKLEESSPKQEYSEDSDVVEIKQEYPGISHEQDFTADPDIVEIKQNFSKCLPKQEFFPEQEYKPFYSEHSAPKPSSYKQKYSQSNQFSRNPYRPYQMNHRQTSFMSRADMSKTIPEAYK